MILYSDKIDEQHATNFNSDSNFIPRCVFLLLNVTNQKTTSWASELISLFMRYVVILFSKVLKSEIKSIFSAF